MHIGKKKKLKAEEEQPWSLEGLGSWRDVHSYQGR